MGRVGRSGLLRYHNVAIERDLLHQYDKARRLSHDCHGGVDSNLYS